MNIYGIGNDIVKIKRLDKILSKNRLFKSRIFSIKEILNCDKKKLRSACYAKRFAAKEAFFKALGTGLSKKMKFNEISVDNNKLGKPFLKVTGNSLKIVKRILKKNKFNTFLTISDEESYAIATVIILT